ncbi:hypothetical protein SK128_021554 [Halocaridina rubra]|uniref:Uncharacterized protein n=1 Tax=Halocaridina rubra TaxID=373956 RepID=A0AAN8ZY79_HALRR
MGVHLIVAELTRGITKATPLLSTYLLTLKGCSRDKMYELSSEVELETFQDYLFVRTSWMMRRGKIASLRMGDHITSADLVTLLSATGRPFRQEEAGRRGRNGFLFCSPNQKTSALEKQIKTEHPDSGFARSYHKWHFLFGGADISLFLKN